MNIYIGFDFSGNPLSVLLADSSEKADIAWAGMNDIPHHIEEIDPTRDDLGIHGVVFLLTSKKINTRDCRDVEFRDWKRGL